ncbi:MAG: tetratricopeptide repeat protein [Bacillota bacterium]
MSFKRTKRLREQAGDQGDNLFSGRKSLERAFDEAVELHRRGVAGDKEAVSKAFALFEKIHEAAPKNNLAAAYYGSSLALQGRDAVDPNERFQKAIRGLKYLDAAAENEPENIQIRTLRGYVCSRLPEAFFHRTHTAIEDFGSLVSRFEKDPGLFAKDFYCQLLYDLGAAYKNLNRCDEAEQTWKKLLSVTGGSKYLNLLRQEGCSPPKNPGSSSSANPSDETRRLEEGRKLHRAALNCRKGAAQSAYDFFTKALDETPGHPLYSAYQADCLSMIGRDAEDPGMMFGNAIKAMKVLDNAVNNNPDNFEIRLLRANHSFRLPEAFFRRTATAISDYEYLTGRYETDPSSFPVQEYWRLLYNLGEAYLRLGLSTESSSVWKKLLELKPDPEYKDAVEKQMDAGLPDRVKHVSLHDKDAYYREAVRLHDLAVNGRPGAAKSALELWEKAFKADPENALAEAYYGSSLALCGRNSTEPNRLFSDTIKGLKHINRAAGKDWKNPQIRLLRAYLTFSLPESFFHMTERAVKDFRYLKSAYEQDTSLFPAGVYYRILYDLGRAYRRLNQDALADKVWKKLSKEHPDLYRELVEGTIPPEEESR